MLRTHKSKGQAKENKKSTKNNQKKSNTPSKTKSIPLKDEPTSTVPRKRNNSLIPVELMNNNKEGGREYAALATVFGIPEYVDSKIFWERQRSYQYNDNTTKKQMSPLAPNAPSFNDTKNDSTPIKSQSVSKNNQFDNSLVLTNSFESSALSSFLDSVFDSVGSNIQTASLRAPAPTPTKSFALPRIPTVSTFNDIMDEDILKNSSMLSISPPSSLLYSSTPLIRNNSIMTIKRSNTITSFVNDNNKKAVSQTSTEKEDDKESLYSSPFSFIVGPPEIFDLILSDDDERFIVWGPDPILLSSSMATTSTPDRPSSYANLYNSQYSRPELKGFSTNATITTANNINKTKNSRPSIISKFKKQSSVPENTEGSILLKKAFGLKKTSSKVKEIDNKYSNLPKVIEAASVHKLIEKLTNTLDYTLMTDFFLTYRDFISSEDLCRLLISRFYWALQNDEESRRVVRIRTFVVLRHWLNNYFVHDFIGNRPLRVVLTDFLNQLPQHPLIKQSPRDQRIVKILKRVVRRLKKLYYNRSSGATRVKVILPPPPTAEQEQMGDIVRAKLSQNVIRRKAAIGLDMTSHHHGNMAVQDTKNAPVVVIGSLNKKPSFVDINNTTEPKNTEDNKAIRSSIHHRYDNGVYNTNESVAGGVGETSSVASVASDDSLESELSAGDTIANDIDHFDDIDDHQHYFSDEDDDIDREWLKEQQETLEYFRLATQSPVNQSPTNENPQLQNSDPTPISSSEQSKISSDASSPPTTPVLQGVKDNQISKENIVITPKTIHRVPSERWCKSDDDYQSHKYPPFEVENSKVLPTDLLKELNETDNGLPTSLSRRLSKKSIERRKSEKSLNEHLHSATSSAANSPHLNGQKDTSHIPEVPELPPSLLEESTKKLNKKPSKTLKKKKSTNNVLKKKKSMTENETPIETFASIPYESTQKLDESKPAAVSPEPSKRGLTRALSKVFRNKPEEKQTDIKDSNQAPTVTPTVSTPAVSAATNTNDQQEKVNAQVESTPQKAQNSQFVSLIAQRLRNNSIDGSDDGKCNCSNCSGKGGSTQTCRRLSIMMIPDMERRQSFELRRKRGASIDHEQRPVDIKQLVAETKEFNKMKQGPIYLGHLQASNQKEQNAALDDDDNSSSTTSSNVTEKTIKTDVQVSSVRGKMSLISDSSRIPQSRITEIDIPPIDSIQDTKELEKPLESIISIPSYIPSSNEPSFIMSYKTSTLATQLCFVERDVLIKVGWEELIHCKWTKMDPQGNIHPAASEKNTFGADQADGYVNYTRQIEKRRNEEQGIEQVIQRFNTVCHWVSSEIVRTKNQNDRVKLIEKFIKLAMKCQMYSNYATLVQILLGLQSPAVARLEKTWAKVSPKYQRQLAKLTEFTSPMKNWKNIRDSMTEVAEEYGNSPSEVQVELPGTTSHKKFTKTTRIKIPFGGCIPFLGIYLSDLVFNFEKPKYLKPNLDNQKIYLANNTRNIPACLDQPLVNFRKHRVIATVIKRVLTFQSLAMRYSFDEDHYLIEKCKNLQVLDAKTIRELSLSLE